MEDAFHHGTKESFVKQFEAKLNDAEKAGWSLPVYHQLLMGDAKAITFSDRDWRSA